MPMNKNKDLFSLHAVFFFSITVIMAKMLYKHMYAYGTYEEKAPNTPL